jgi:aspartyl-tRNA(Asn)/glutamyl-tRNA(Gln) amidotransferase subunit C
LKEKKNNDRIKNYSTVFKWFVNQKIYVMNFERKIFMKITEKEVGHIADLSRLILSEEEKQGFQKDLNTILERVGKLNELDTEGVKPSAHVFRIKSVLREDKVEESMNRELILQNAPEEENGCFKVPRIVE